MRKSLVALLVALMALTGYAAAQEVHTLTTPATVTTTTYTLTYVGLDVAGNRIVVNLTSNTGVLVSKVYDNSTAPTGAALLSALNTSNNSAGTSLIRRVYNRLIADGVLPAGTVSGSPQH